LGVWGSGGEAPKPLTPQTPLPWRMNFQNSEEQNALFKNSEKIFVSSIGKVLLSLYSSSLISLQIPQIHPSIDDTETWKSKKSEQPAHQKQNSTVKQQSEHKKKFLSYPYEKYTQKYLFFTKKKSFLSRLKKSSFEKTINISKNIGEKQAFFQKESKSNMSFLTSFDKNSQKKSILQVYNKSIDFQNKQISQKSKKNCRNF
jgi:hypothetical protein